MSFHHRSSVPKHVRCLRAKSRYQRQAGRPKIPWAPSEIRVPCPVYVPGPNVTSSTCTSIVWDKSCEPSPQMSFPLQRYPIAVRNANPLEFCLANTMINGVDPESKDWYMIDFCLGSSTTCRITGCSAMQWQLSNRTNPMTNRDAFIVVAPDKSEKTSTRRTHDGRGPAHPDQVSQNYTACDLTFLTNLVRCVIRWTSPSHNPCLSPWFSTVSVKASSCCTHEETVMFASLLTEVESKNNTAKRVWTPTCLGFTKRTA